MKFNIILAVDEKNWLWKLGDLAWKLPWDLKYFKKTTSKTKDLGKHNVVIMWRKTWDSIPGKFRPLPDRINCILSKTLKTESIDSDINDFVLYFNDFDHCLKELDKKDNIETVYLIWGWSLYNQFINHPKLKKIYITKVLWDFDCDVFFDGIPKNFYLKKYSDDIEENGVKYRFEQWKKIKQS